MDGWMDGGREGIKKMESRYTHTHMHTCTHTQQATIIHPHIHAPYRKDDTDGARAAPQVVGEWRFSLGREATNLWLALGSSPAARRPLLMLA
jgi:hypothetical protein